MSVNDQTAGAASPRKPSKWLRLIGVIVLSLGLAGAGTVYWRGTHSAEPTEDELLPGNARAESRQMGVLFGKMGILTQELSDDLKQPGTQVILIAGVSILIAAGCFYFARLSDDDETP
jgi:flagellar basal body-associated protein FliL